MKITVMGSGYVGLVSGACLAELGNEVLYVDIDTEKIGQQGQYSPLRTRLKEIIRRNIARFYRRESAPQTSCYF